MRYQKLPGLLKQVKTETNPVEFKEALLRAAELYFDGLVEELLEKHSGLLFWKQNLVREDSDIWAEQKEALDALLLGIQMTVSGFYRNNRNVPFSDVKDVVLPHDSPLIEYGSKRACKGRWLDEYEHDVGWYTAEVAEALKDGAINLIIPLASGGFEPAALTADYLGVKHMLPVRHSHVSRHDEAVLIPKYAPDDYPERQIKGSNVLIVEDIIASGRTASMVVNWVKKHSPAKVYLSVIRSRHDCFLPNSAGMHVSDRSRHLYQEKEKSQRIISYRSPRNTLEKFLAKEVGT